MKKINPYYKGYNDNSSKKDYLKYGLINERGYDIESSCLNFYDEEKIIKTTSCFSNSFKKFK